MKRHPSPGVVEGMKLFGITFAILVLVTLGHSQGNAPLPKIKRQPVQIRVRHADPWAIKAMLEGQKIVSPELSTIWNLMGVPPQVTQGTNALFDDGKFIVNPADNSLWFIPN